MKNCIFIVFIMSLVGCAHQSVDCSGIESEYERKQCLSSNQRRINMKNMFSQESATQSASDAAAAASSSTMHQIP